MSKLSIELNDPDKGKYFTLKRLLQARLKGNPQYKGVQVHFRTNYIEVSAENSNINTGNLRRDLEAMTTEYTSGWRGSGFKIEQLGQKKETVQQSTTNQNTNYDTLSEICNALDIPVNNNKPDVMREKLGSKLGIKIAPEDTNSDIIKKIVQTTTEAYDLLNSAEEKDSLYEDRIKDLESQLATARRIAGASVRAVRGDFVKKSTVQKTLDENSRYKEDNTRLKGDIDSLEEQVTKLEKKVQLYEATITRHNKDNEKYERLLETASVDYRQSQLAIRKAISALEKVKSKTPTKTEPKETSTNYRKSTGVTRPQLVAEAVANGNTNAEKILEYLKNQHDIDMKRGTLSYNVFHAVKQKLIASESRGVYKIGEAYTPKQ